jgi:hypothetical protein
VCIVHPCLCSGMLVSCDPMVGPVVLIVSHTVHGLQWRASLTMWCTLSRAVLCYYILCCLRLVYYEVLLCERELAGVQSGCAPPRCIQMRHFLSGVSPYLEAVRAEVPMYPWWLVTWVEHGV